MTPHARANRLRPAARLAAVLLLLTLAWPSFAICLPNAPGAMPCCAKREAGAPPTARACCGESPASPATAQTSGLSVLLAPQHATASFIVATTESRPIALALCARPSRADIRLLNSVFLI